MTATTPHLPGLEAVPRLPTPTADEDDWFTPQFIIDWLPPIGLDPAWHPRSNVADYGARFDLRRGEDGLTLPWTLPPDYFNSAIAFSNPPYSDCAAWVERAESQAGAVPVVALIPAKPGEQYWHRHIWPSAAVGFIRGRVAFDTVAGKGKACGVFTSALVVWGDDRDRVVAEIARRAAGHPQAPVWVAPLLTGVPALREQGDLL